MEKKASVIVRHLNAPYQEESRTHFKPLGAEMVKEIKTAVTEIFDKSGGENLLKESREVFIKPNGIDGQPYCYTRPEVVEAVIEYWKTHGAKKIWLFENSTQSNATRLVFAVIGYDKICRRTGAVPVYLHIPAEKITLLAPLMQWCDGGESCVQALASAFGAENVKLVQSAGR